MEDPMRRKPKVIKGDGPWKVTLDADGRIMRIEVWKDQTLALDGYWSLADAEILAR